MNRREALVRLGALMAAGPLGIGTARALAEDTTTSKVAAAITSGKSFTIAHITDEHITDDYHSDKWVSQCLRQIQSHPDKPSILLNTGDTVYDSTRTDRAKAEHYWKIWNTTLKRESSLPIYSVLGNHDVWGARLPTDNPAVKDPMFGKKLGQERMGIEKLYYTFDQGNWRFIMLDSVAPYASDSQYNWVAKLGDEQMAWLKGVLEETPADRPIVVCSHIPILQVASVAYRPPDENGQYTLGPKNMITEANEIITLFRKHPNVKLCFSGHTHNRDRITLGDTTFINAGSVCGAQWRVADQNPEKPGYSIATLHPDGTFNYKYENYGWKNLS